MAALAAGFLGLPSGYQLNTVAASSTLTGQHLRVVRGWPTRAQLDPDLKAGTAVVSVFPLPNHTKLTTRYVPQWRQPSVAVPTLTATVAGAAVAFGGTGGAGQVVGIKIGVGFGAQAYPYRVQAGDTPASVAAALGTAIPGASVAGSTVTLATNEAVVARVVADQTVMAETRRQTQIVSVDCWCPTPEGRDAVAGAVDAGFANMMDSAGRLTMFFALADGSEAWLRYAASATDDSPQNANLWRRTLRYSVEYATTLTLSLPEMLFGVETIAPNGGPDTFTSIA